MIPGPFILVFLFIVLPLLGVPIYFIWLRMRETQAPGPSVGTIVTWVATMTSIFVLMVNCSSHIKMETGRSEARKNLLSIFNAMSQYHSKTSEYPAGSDTFELIEWIPLDENQYAYFCAGDAYPNVQGEQVTKKPGAEWPFPVSPGASPTGFTCMAVGNIDMDRANDVYSIDDSGELKWVVEDINPGGSPLVKVVLIPLVGLSLAFPVFLLVNLIRIRRARKARAAAGSDING